MKSDNSDSDNYSDIQPQTSNESNTSRHSEA